MKDFVQNAGAFIMFDSPRDINYIREQFITTHTENQRNFPGWSTKSTRQKLLASYWLKEVLNHFGFIFGVPALVLMLTFPEKAVILAVVLAVGFITFAVLWFFHYWPVFLSIFLPNLESVKETYEQKQLEQLEKCKRAQLSNSALVLIYYVLDKVSGVNTLQCNDRFAALLTRLYGVDSGSIKKNLELIFGNKKTVSPRKLTEIQNRFQEAYDFFQEIEFPEGSKMLHELEQKFRTN
jgi:hypothetical protein